MKHDDQITRTPSASGKFAPQNLRGILIPFPTPFDSDGHVDTQALRTNIERWSETGIDGYVALGSTGERVHLDEREALEVIETARAVVPERFAFIVGTGQQSTRATIKESQRAARAGADALLVITPHFYRGAMTHGALVEHFTAVADASHAPVVLYNIPQNTGLALAPETIARLAEHENVIGVKDSSGDFLNLAETLRLVPSEFAVLTGNASLLYAALAAGARGAILAAACTLPRAAVEIYQAVAAGEHARAHALQQRLVPIARAVTTRYGIGGLKVALEICGYRGGAVRAPLAAPDEAARREIERLLAESGLVPDGTARQGEAVRAST